MIYLTGMLTLLAEGKGEPARICLSGVCNRKT